MHRRILLVFPLIVVLLLFWPGTGEAAAPDREGLLVHVVRSGDTITSIAQQYGATESDLMVWNNLRQDSRLVIGQRLVVQQGQANTIAAAGKSIHVVRKGETLSRIARKYGTSVAAIKKANNLRSDTIFIGQRLRIPAGSQKPATPTSIHVVGEGETLAAIASRYGTTVADLARLNGLINTSFIKVGQRLTVPASKGSTTSQNEGKPRGKKKVVVDISEQRCYRYEGETLLNKWRCSTGQKGFGTRTGTFRVQSKLRKAYGSKWNIWMPYWLGIYWAGPVENGFHGLPWKADTGRKIWGGLVGTPATFGCVMLKDTPMKELWEWADIGTQIVIKR